MAIFANESPPVSKAQTIKTTVYADFRGVDYVHDAYTCAKNRCPELINMWSPTRGILEGRTGFKTQRKFEGKINCIAHGFVQGMRTFVHEGKNLWAIGSEVSEDVLIFSDLNDEKSVIFFEDYQQPFLVAQEEPVKSKTIGLVLDGENYYYIDYIDSFFIVEPVESIATIPVVTIAGAPAGGGTVLQPVNLLQSGRTHKAYGNASAKVFQLPFKDLAANEVEVVEITATGTKTYKENAAGELGFTVDRALGTVTFNTAPPAPPVEGTDNIYITSHKVVEGYADRIKKCRAQIQYGKGGALRAFVTRNPNYRNYDWWSEPQDPTYFPDLNYGICGSENTAIVGYMIFQGALIIIKESNGNDITFFARTPQVTEEQTYFITEVGGLNAGAISPYAFANIIDEPLFLTKDGVFSMVSDVISQRATLQNRSYWVDARLKKEANLKNAVAVEWKGHYIVSVNGNTYLLDGRQGEVVDRQKTSVYNAYYWNGFSPTCYLQIDGELYFGTSDGRLCKFSNGDLYTDFADDDTAIEYLMATKQDDDGVPMYKKTMQKKGNSISLKPLARSSVDVYLNSNIGTHNLQNPNSMVAEYLDLFNFENVNFERISFVSNTFTQPKNLRQRVKKYGTLQFVLQSKKIYEPFAVVAIAKSYTITQKGVGY